MKECVGCGKEVDEKRKYCDRNCYIKNCFTKIWLGRKHSKSTKYKMSQSAVKAETGKWNVGNTHYLGKKHSEETKKLISKGGKGKKTYY